MTDCLYRCPTISGATFEERWDSARYHYGPRNFSSAAVRDERLNSDINDFVEWATEHGKDSFDEVLFGSWLNWKFSIGTNNYGNLPTRKRDHVGIQCIPCPYDTPPTGVSDTVWDERSLLMVGEIPTERIDHGAYYMRVASRGHVWGFECTSDVCPHYTETGTRYFKS